ncbi:MAG: hypothetical protein IKE45_08010 [Halomonas sp.]|nr:hypothetical protein [Halomonas sp.]MBR2513955.1 hypothetical protein [Halomonas sp.]
MDTQYTVESSSKHSGHSLTARLHFARQWMAKHQRKFAKGGIATSLTLPLMAQAAMQDGDIVIEQLDGVANASTQADGSLVLELSDGRILEIPAQHVSQSEGQTLVNAQALQQAEADAWVRLDTLPDIEDVALNQDGSVTVTQTDGSQHTLAEGTTRTTDGQVVGDTTALTEQGLLSAESYASVLPDSATTVPGGSVITQAGYNITPGMVAGAGAIAVGGIAITANNSSSSDSSGSASSQESTLRLDDDADFDTLDLEGVDTIISSSGSTLSATSDQLDGFEGVIQGSGDLRIAVEDGFEENVTIKIELEGGNVTFTFTEGGTLVLSSESVMTLDGADLFVTGGTLDVSNIEGAENFSGVNNVTLNSGLIVNVDQLASLEKISTGTDTESSFNVVIRSQQDLDTLSSLDLSGKFSDDDGLSVSFKVEAGSTFDQRTLENSLKEQENSLSESIGKTVSIESSPLTPFDFSGSPSIDSVRQYLSALTNEDIGDNGDNILYGELTDITLSTDETVTVQKIPGKDNLVYLEDGINYHTLDNGLTLVTIEFLEANTETEELTDWGYTQWLVFDEDGFITQSNSFFPEPGNIIAAVQNDDPSTVYFQSLHIDVENGEISYPDPNKLFTLYSLSSDNLLATLSSVEGDNNSLIGADSVTAVLTLGAEDLGFTPGDNEDVFLDKVSFDGETGKLLVAKNDTNGDESFYLVAIDTSSDSGQATEVIDLTSFGIFDDMAAALRAFDIYEGDGLDLPSNDSPISDSGSIDPDSSYDLDWISARLAFSGFIGEEEVSFNSAAEFISGDTANFSSLNFGIEANLEFSDVAQWGVENGSAVFIEDNRMPAEWGSSATKLIGSHFSDILIHDPNMNNSIRGLGGDDLILIFDEPEFGEISNNTIVFEPTASQNGTDIILGFNTGSIENGGDLISIANTDLSLQIVSDNDTLGADNNLMVFTSGNVQDAITSLNSLGLENGEVIYFVANSDNGSSNIIQQLSNELPEVSTSGAQLVRFEAGSSDHETLALFNGMEGSLADFGEENIQSYNSTTV